MKLRGVMMFCAGFVMAMQAAILLANRKPIVRGCAAAGADWQWEVDKSYFDSGHLVFSDAKGHFLEVGFVRPADAKPIAKAMTEWSSKGGSVL